jgi:hypothetical protein
MKVSGMPHVVAVLLLATTAGAPATAKEDLPLPPGWQPVDLDQWFAESRDTRCEGRRSRQQPGLRVEGDFDGDGRIDVARILVKAEGTHEPSVLISHHRGDRLVHADVGGVGPGDDISVIPCMGIRRATPTEPCPPWRRNGEPCWNRDPGDDPAGIVVFHIGREGSADAANAILWPRHVAWDADKAAFVDVD